MDELSNQTRRRSHSANKPAGLTGVDLNFIRQAAKGSLLIQSESSKGEQLSKSAVLPPNINLQDTQVSRFLGTAAPTQPLISAMVLLDLVSVASDNSELCQQLLTTAQKHIPLLSGDRRNALPGKERPTR